MPSSSSRTAGVGLELDNSFSKQKAQARQPLDDCETVEQQHQTYTISEVFQRDPELDIRVREIEWKEEDLLSTPDLCNHTTPCSSHCCMLTQHAAYSPSSPQSDSSSTGYSTSFVVSRQAYFLTNMENHTTSCHQPLKDPLKPTDRHVSDIRDNKAQQHIRHNLLYSTPRRPMYPQARASSALRHPPSYWATSTQTSSGNKFCLNQIHAAKRWKHKHQLAVLDGIIRYIEELQQTHNALSDENEALSHTGRSISQLMDPSIGAVKLRHLNAEKPASP